jgi:hypothetical protein
LLGHLVGKENLLDADESTGPMVGCIAVKEACVTELIAIAVARLLRQHAGNLVGDLIGACNHRGASVARGRQETRKGFGGVRAVVVRRHRPLWLGRCGGRVVGWKRGDCGLGR